MKLAFYVRRELHVAKIDGDLRMTVVFDRAEASELLYTLLAVEYGLAQEILLRGVRSGPSLRICGKGSERGRAVLSVSDSNFRAEVDDELLGYLNQFVLETVIGVPRIDHVDLEDAASSAMVTFRYSGPVSYIDAAEARRLLEVSDDESLG